MLVPKLKDARYSKNLLHKMDLEKLHYILGKNSLFDKQLLFFISVVLDTIVQISFYNSKMIKRRSVFSIMILEREIFSQITQHELIILTQVTVCRINHNYAVNQKSSEKVNQQRSSLHNIILINNLPSTSKNVRVEPNYLDE